MKRNSSFLLPVLGLTTIAWVGLAIWLLIRPIACSGQDTEIVAINCLSLNELGDFLAGAFAPLAFIWLAAAVFIQARELKAQRNELELTREELKLARAVAVQQTEATNAQALEAKRSADHFELQTRILEDEQRSRHEEEAKKMLQIFVRRIDGVNTNGVKILVGTDKKVDPHKYFHLHLTAQRSTIDNYTEIIQNWTNEVSSGQKLHMSQDLFDSIVDVSQWLAEIVLLIPKLSEADRKFVSLNNYEDRSIGWRNFLTSLREYEIALKRESQIESDKET